MCNKLSEMLKKITNGWTILLFLALLLVFAGVIVPTVQHKLEAISGGSGPIDLMLSYTPDKAYSVIASFGDEGRSMYRAFAMSADIVYPVVYSVFFSLLITWLFQRGFKPVSKMQLLNIVPLGALLFDWFENINIITMLSIYPSQPPIVAQLSSICTSVKWGFGGVGFVLVLIGFAMALKNGFKKQS